PAHARRHPPESRLGDDLQRNRHPGGCVRLRDATRRVTWHVGVVACRGCECYSSAAPSSADEAHAARASRSTPITMEPAVDILMLLIPLSVVLALLIAAGFWWSVDSGQFDDLDGPAHRILADDDSVHLPNSDSR